MTPSKLDRSLRLFTEVRAGEGATALLMFCNVFLILCAYYFIKPLREGWLSVSDIEGLSQMELKAYSSFGQTVCLIPIVWAYARLAGRVQRSDLITLATLFCMSNMVIFWALQPNFFLEALPVTGLVFYLWVGMFGVFVVAQFWAFTADIYTEERGNRLMPFVAIGATAGAASGSWITDGLLGLGLIETEWLLIVALVPLALGIVLTRIVDRRESPPAPEASRAAPPMGASPGTPEGAVDRPGGLSVVFQSRFLLAVAGITLLLNWVNTNGETLLYTVVQDSLAGEAGELGITAPDELMLFTRDGTTAFFANFYGWTNLVALLLQAFVASRLLKHGGFAPLLLLLPVVALLSYSAMALIPVLAIVKIMKIAENSTDYSINNTARHVLWLPVSSELKYQGKTTIDTLFVRFGDGLAALTVLVGVRALALPTTSFFVINVGLVVVWLAFSFVVIREHRRVSEEAALREA